MSEGSAPRYVALCGAPGVGKSTVAELLRDRYGARIVDDGAALRYGVYAIFGGVGVEMRDPFTQEGKAREVTICGRAHKVRNLLGDLGNYLERHYGEQIMPELALAEIEDARACGLGSACYVFPSCRKNQGLTYRARGGLVVEVSRPGHVPVNDFDHYDQSLVTHTIPNHGDLRLLAGKVAALFDPVLGGF